MANFNVGPLLAFASGNLCYQIEHHLFPDLPATATLRSLPGCGRCADVKFDLPYTTCSPLGQYRQGHRSRR
jgi:NADPH-dependent stearoyl-CoA 9-desaturase